MVKIKDDIRQRRIDSILSSMDITKNQSSPKFSPRGKNTVEGHEIKKA